MCARADILGIKKHFIFSSREERGSSHAQSREEPRGGGETVGKVKGLEELGVGLVRVGSRDSSWVRLTSPRPRSHLDTIDARWVMGAPHSWYGGCIHGLTGPAK